ncbi:conserved hypothetical protein [Crocosphaera subtropica ATCC 51142]|uniref:Uncharacterized protein n=1 Tax=Crocosphaera subtropica (strain ATCC 51142 / BH68) TaxID=43989 RepID=B1WV31_CROS5|nr:hypothetical protein [Crocosphaera subtropica]ACB52228.1 conserved hypothetical protein [Crocosphaera subtropica ATCC 51142]
MGNYHSDQPIQPEFEPHLGDVDYSNKRETLNADIVMDLGEYENEESSEITEISIVEEEDIPLTQDWFNLARKLRGQNRELLDTIVTLEKALAESRQQLQDYQERSRHHNALLSQQTAQLQSTQAENSHLLEQLQTSQTQLQQQQLNLDALQQQLQASQAAFAQLERECALLKEETLQNKHQLVLKERQINELQQRLQRQQRYSLQYKAALDHCLSSHAKKIPSAEVKSTIDRQTASNVVSIQPWSSSLETKIPPSLTPSAVPSDESDHCSSNAIDETLEELFSLTPDQTLPIAENQEVTQEETKSNEMENHNPQGQTATSSNSLLVSSSVPFSFSIDRHRKEDAAREKVDLPSFLRRQS